MATQGQIHRTRIAGKQSGAAHGEGKIVMMDMTLPELAQMEFRGYWQNMQDVEEIEAGDEENLRKIFVEGFEEGFAGPRRALIDLNKAALISGRTASALRYAIGRRDLTAEKYGGSWVVKYDDLKAWMDAPELHKTGFKAPKSPRATLTRRDRVRAGMTFTQNDIYELKDCEQMSVRAFASAYADMRRQCPDCSVFVYVYVDGRRVSNWRQIIDLANIDAMEDVDLSYFEQ